MRLLTGLRGGLVAAFMAVTLGLVNANETSNAAGSFPSKPVTVKVAYPPGGPADVSVRVTAATFSKELGQSLIVQNQAGALGSLAAMSVWGAPGDGYTLLGTTGMDFVLAPTIVPTAKYQPASFRLVAVTGISDFVLVAAPKHAFRNLEELAEYVRDRKNPELTIAHWGNGSAPHIVAADFQGRTGMKFNEIPYKGAAPAAADVAGGQVDLTFLPLGGPVIAMIRDGKLKPLGLAADRRSAALPDVPALAESDRLKGFSYALWSAVLAPPQTPEAIVERMAKAFNVWLDGAENQTRMTTNGSRRVEARTYAELQAFLATETQKISRVAQQLKLAPQ